MIENNMLYYNLQNKKVYTDYFEEGESFTPSSYNQTQGWVLVVVYTTYDSYGESNEENFAVLDLYDDKKEAFRNAQLIHNQKYERGSRDVLNGVLYNSTAVVRGAEFVGWGSKIKRVEVHYIEEFSKEEEKTSRTWE